jgi:hypothetical protein
VRALRVVQARGDWSFGQGVDPPDEVVVTVGTERKSFPMSQTFPSTPCLTREPDEGSPFPVGRPTVGGLGRLRELIPFPLPPAKAHCCVRRFAAPLHVQPDPAVKSEHFDMGAALTAPATGFPGVLTQRGCRCACCEYRQYVRGTFTNADGQTVPFDLPSGPLSPTSYCEDGAIDEFGPGKHGFYGHRQTSTPGDQYTGTGGCTYSANETTSCPPTETAHLEFLGLLVDTCRGRVVAKRTWTVDL